MTIVIPLILLIAFLFQVWVTIRLWRSDLYVRSEKANQSKLVWLLPVLGAVMVLTILSEEDRAHATESHERR